jgi:hypothetical protein
MLVDVDTLEHSSLLTLLLLAFYCWCFVPIHDVEFGVD